MRLSTLCALVLILHLTACQTTTHVRVGEFDRPTEAAKLNVFMLKHAVDARSDPGNQVGRHTISLLTIPGPTVSAEEPLDEAVGEHARAAFEAAGYHVTPVARVDDAVGPVVVTQIDDLRNYQFTWLYPLGILWGKLDMTLLLVDPKSEVLWRAQTKGHGGMWASLLYMGGFGTRVKSDLTANLNQMIEIASSEEFKQALRNAQGGGQSQN